MGMGGACMFEEGFFVLFCWEYRFWGLWVGGFDLSIYRGCVRGVARNGCLLF